MDINKLLSMTVEELEAMTDQQLLDYFAPILHKTQPHLHAPESVKEKKPRKKKDSTPKPSMPDDLTTKMEMLQARLATLNQGTTT